MGSRSACTRSAHRRRAALRAVPVVAAVAQLHLLPAHLARPVVRAEHLRAADQQLPQHPVLLHRELPAHLPPVLRAEPANHLGDLQGRSPRLVTRVALQIRAVEGGLGGHARGERSARDDPGSTCDPMPGRLAARHLALERLAAALRRGGDPTRAILRHLLAHHAARTRAPRLVHALSRAVGGAVADRHPLPRFGPQALASEERGGSTRHCTRTKCMPKGPGSLKSSSPSASPICRPGSRKRPYATSSKQ